jgi:hypothetical protein
MIYNWMTFGVGLVGRVVGEARKMILIASTNRDLHDSKYR